MGNRSKGGQYTGGGAHGKKHFVAIKYFTREERETLIAPNIKTGEPAHKVKAIVNVPHKDVIGVVRPNRGSGRRRQSIKISRKGFKPIKLSDIKLRRDKQFSDSSVIDKKPGFFGSAKKLFQRKASDGKG